MDGSILIWIQDNIRQEWLTPVMKVITSLGNAGLVWIALSVVLVCFRKTRRAGIGCAIALICSLIINNLILKNLVARTRPYEVVDGLKLLVAKASDYSFPSGHSGSSFAASVVMLRLLPKKFGIPAIILATLIALSRLYVGIHYPTDVLAGIITGTICGIIAIKLSKKLNIA